MAIKRVSPVAKELKRLRESARPEVTIREMASELRMPSHTSYAYYEDGYKKPLLPQDIARKAASFLSKRGVDENEVLALGGLVPTADGHKLTATETDASRVVEISGIEFARIPVYDIRFAAGAGAANYDETPIDHYLVSLSFLRSMTDAPLDQIAAFQANGDSMEPTINNRDWCVADLRKTKLFNPGIYALVWEGEGLLKRASQHLETLAVTLVSDNKAYEPQTIKKPDRLGVVGRVFMSIRRH
jgi:phage repressor protein C with HTH and peptisase S24 domain